MAMIPDYHHRVVGPIQNEGTTLVGKFPASRTLGRGKLR